MRKKLVRLFIIYLLAFLPSISAYSGVIGYGIDDYKPSGKGFPSSNQSTLKATIIGYGINYHGGSIMAGGTNIYYIWYGDWRNRAGSQNIIRDFGNGIGGSNYININTTYYDSLNNRPSNAVNLRGEYSDPGTLGTSLTDENIKTIVSNALSSLPIDPRGIYFVLTDPTVRATSGFCTSYCGWHSFTTIYGTAIKYSFVGNPASQCPSACEAQSRSPNGDPAADAMVSTIAHELEESISDPQLDAWYDSNGMENADKCAWTFGSTYTVNGAQANMVLGSRNFLIQQNWVNTPPSGGCVLGYYSSATITSVSPNTGTTAGGTNITINGTNFTGATAVSVGGTPVQSFSVSNATTITAVTAAHAAGAATISVTTPAGSVSSSTTLFTYF